MISNVHIISMAMPVIFSFVLFACLIIFFKKKFSIATKPIVIGAIGFFVVTQVLEKILHVIVITNFPNYADHPWAFGIYGAFAAGIFEEIGRFILFVWLLKKYQDYKGGLAFGVGWGGFEAVAIMLLQVVPNIAFALLIKNGTFEAQLANSLSPDQLLAIKDGILNTPSSFYLWGIPERFFAVFMQMAFSLIVLLGVVRKRFSYVILAILIHAVIDFPAVFFQTGHLSQIWMIEAYFAVIGIASFIFLKKAKKWF